MLIIFAGLPGSGKSTLARALAARTGAVWLRIDSIEQALTNSTLKIRPVEDAGYMAAYAVAADNLRLGRTVVADSVNPIELTRTAWRDVARRVGCASVDVEVVCSDTSEHRCRVEGRVTDVPGLAVPTWQQVLDRDYQPWTPPPVVIDTAARDVASCVDDLVAQLPVRF
jgi:predicted kinase